MYWNQVLKRLPLKCIQFKSEANVKVSSKWTLSKRSEAAWEVHFDGVYLEVNLKMEKGSQGQAEKPREFWTHPAFTYETQFFNPN